MLQLAAPFATLTIDIDPRIELGPLSIAWHGLTTALGIALGTAVAARYAKRRGLELDPLFSSVLLLTLVGIAGARFVYLLENDAAALLRPGDWVGSRGFSFYGGMIFGTAAVAIQLARRRLSVGYLDAMAAGFPLGMALGRVGDLINGEHYGPVSDAPWAIRYPNPDADVPSGAVAYHPGGLYEITLALLIGLLIWALRRHLRYPGMLLWTVVGAYGAGRFLMFFYRADSEPLALGLDTSQWLSMLLVLVALIGLGLSSEHSRRELTRSAGTMGLGAACLAVAVAAGCGGGDEGADDKPVTDRPVVADPGAVHVHGLGINPKDGALFVATHTGLFRAARGQRAKRVGGRYQDTMAFAVLGPDRFIGSGHPDGRDKLPPFLGLIESRDAGKSWKPISLQGRVDFHLLRIARRTVYGFGSDFKTGDLRFMVSRTGGRSWSDRSIPEPFNSLAVDPSDGERLVASGESGLYLSPDAGRTWRALHGAAGLLAWPPGERLYRADGKGVVSASRDGGRSWRAVGELGGAPAAFEHGRGPRLLAALHGGTIKESADGAATWKLRSRP